MDSLRRAFLKFDRRHGGAEPPPRVQVSIARHPVRSGVVFGVLQGLLFVWALSGFDDPERVLQGVLSGLGTGLLCWLFCRFERRRQAHYERTGGFRPAPPKPPLQAPPPVWFQGMVLWICHWAFFTVFLRLWMWHFDSPSGWLGSAVLAGITVMALWAIHLAKHRRRNRRPGPADRAEHRSDLPD
ncbi:hypothetical protein KUF83_15025 [Streptomyces sp. BV286]|uniref:hypothetical protein n=1 Tax=unclassified Streptomyces TaxID=2593676 RepID=UPI001C2E2605|nr:hypothetical protein [Streptomyces sp. BV286]MBV1937867.1 hypothetical protein [Streptomyces sp. BV286]